MENHSAAWNAATHFNGHLIILRGKPPQKYEQSNLIWTTIVLMEALGATAGASSVLIA